mmetsp:Transcript_38561/g.94453  ORF Transcript_38561/g.94453 Transcript_38561/m.94453 type:complete len:151 (-) Transcript_38561:145-597(-)
MSSGHAAPGSADVVQVVTRNAAGKVVQLLVPPAIEILLTPWGSNDGPLLYLRKRQGNGAYVDGVWSKRVAFPLESGIYQMSVLLDRHDVLASQPVVVRDCTPGAPRCACLLRRTCMDGKPCDTARNECPFDRSSLTSPPPPPTVTRSPSV